MVTQGFCPVDESTGWALDGVEGRIAGNLKVWLGFDLRVSNGERGGGIVNGGMKIEYEVRENAVCGGFMIVMVAICDD